MRRVFDARHQQAALRQLLRGDRAGGVSPHRSAMVPVLSPGESAVCGGSAWVSPGVRPTDSGVVLAVRRVVSQWYHAGMGMTLRTSEKQTEALRRQALAEGRSMQAVALSAIDEYIERRAHQTEVNALLDKVIERERGVLRRLADT